MPYIINPSSTLKCLSPMLLLLLPHSLPSPRMLTTPGQRASSISRPPTTARMPAPLVTILVGHVLVPRMFTRLQRVLVVLNGPLTAFPFKTLSRQGPSPLIVASSVCLWLLTTQHRCEDAHRSGTNMMTRGLGQKSLTPVDNWWVLSVLVCTTPCLMFR